MEIKKIYSFFSSPKQATQRHGGRRANSHGGLTVSCLCGTDPDTQKFLSDTHILSAECVGCWEIVPKPVSHTSSTLILSIHEGFKAMCRCVACFREQKKNILFVFGFFHGSEFLGVQNRSLNLSGLGVGYEI